MVKGVNMPLRMRRRRRSAIGVIAAVLVVLLGATAGAASGTGQDQSIPGFQQGTAPYSGGSLHYYRGGSGPVLVLLHGWPEDSYTWSKVMPDLAAAHTVVALDLPGLGRSSIPSGGYDAATTARRIHEAVHALGYHQVAVMGHDLGALIAYDYARDYPSEVTRLAALETPLNGFGLENVYGVSWHFAFNMTAAPTPENIVNNQLAVRTYLGWLYDGSAHHPEAIPREVYFKAYADPAHRSAGYDYYRAFPANATDNKANAGAKRLTMPVLAMGAQFIFGPAVAASFRQVAGDVREVIAPDSGHFISLENPTFLTDCAGLFFGPPQTTPPPAQLSACAP